MSVTFTKVSASTTTTVTPVKGAITYEAGEEIRGGRVTPAVSAGNIRNGSVQVVVEATTESTLIALQSVDGPGDYNIAGSDITGHESYAAIIDIADGEGEDGVEVMTISWKGTTQN